MDYGRSCRCDDDKRNNGQKVAVDIGDDASKEVAKRRKPRSPEHTADDVVCEERFVLHAADSRKNGREGPNDRHKTSKDDGFFTVGFVEAARSLEMLFMKEERIFFFKDARAHFSPKRVAETVARNGTGERDENKERKIEITLRRKKSSREKKAVPGEKKPYEKPRLGENDT